MGLFGAQELAHFHGMFGSTFHSRYTSWTWPRAPHAAPKGTRGLLTLTAGRSFASVIY